MWHIDKTVIAPDLPKGLNNTNLQLLEKSFAINYLLTIFAVRKKGQKRNTIENEKRYPS